MNELKNILLTIDGMGIMLLAVLMSVVWILRGKRLAYLGIVIVALVCFSGYFFVPRFPVYEYTWKKDRCCEVVKVYNSQTWMLRKGDGTFVANFCHNYDLSSYDPAPGLMMWKFRYLDLGACWDIKDKQYGFWWMKDPSTGKDILVSELYKWKEN